MALRRLVRGAAVASCVVADPSTGVLSVSVADPCTSFVVVTPAEYAAIAASPFALTAEDGATLSLAILAVWAVAWSIRAVIHALNVDGEVEGGD